LLQAYPRRPPARSPEVKKKKDCTINQTKVLEMTLMSYHNLRRKIRAGDFPGPIGKNKYGKPIYDENAVKQWVKDNTPFCQRLLHSTATIDLFDGELRQVSKAAKLLNCDIESFIIDAAVWKARKIFEHIGEA
jgi:hypothetical protein